MTDWTNRTSQYNSPLINADDDVINNLTDTIDGYGTLASWDKRTEPGTPWGSGELWTINYLPWEETALPWQKGTITTNWTKR